MADTKYYNGKTHIFYSDDGGVVNLLAGSGQTLNLASTFTPTGTLSLDAGTATLPAINFTLDTNTGIYNNAADQLSFTTGGSSKMTVTNNVVTLARPIGLPNSSPSSLALYFNNDPDTGLCGNNANQLSIVTGGIERLILGPTVTTSINLNQGLNGTLAAPSYSFTADTDTGLYSSAANNLDVAVGGLNRLNVSSTGLTTTGVSATSVSSTSVSATNLTTSTLTMPSDISRYGFFKRITAVTHVGYKPLVFDSAINQITGLTYSQTGNTPNYNGTWTNTSANAMTLSVNYSFYLATLTGEADFFVCINDVLDGSGNCSLTKDLLAMTVIPSGSNDRHRNGGVTFNLPVNSYFCVFFGSGTTGSNQPFQPANVSMVRLL